MCMAHHSLPGLLLGLGEIEDRYAIRVAVVVGSCDRLDCIGLIADVLPNNPATGATLQAAITEMQSGFDRPEMGLAPCRELQPCRPRADIRVAYCSGHVEPRVQLHGQY